MSHVAMKIAKKKNVRKGGRGSRVQEAKSGAKPAKSRSLSKEAQESAKAEAEKKKVVAKKQKAMMQEAADKKMTEKVEIQPDSANGCEPKGRGAPPPLPTPIATFNF